ncbi:MAG: low temperature requirement protein A [Pseudolysinimonas sp.]
MPSLIRMSGRDPEQSHRGATPLELLFDLAFVVAFGQAADQFAHAVADDHTAVGLGGFAFAMFSICWAWINFSWFASAFDTDDWFYRLTTMVQMVGVIVLALGIPPLFDSLLEGDRLDNGVIVAGYVIMRVAMVVQWLRVAKQSPEHRRIALSYVTFILIAQLGWVVLAVLDLNVATFVPFAFLLYAIELGGPIVVDRKVGSVPWHSHHIAERYGLLAIIAFGEVVFGTVASVASLVDHQGWSVQAGLVAFAGIGIAFGLWWTYFIAPSGDVLARQRGRVFVWGYGHVLLYTSIAAAGAGLHVVAYVIEGESKVGVTGAVLAIAIPVLVFSLISLVLYAYLVRQWDSLHVALLGGTIVMLVVAVMLAVLGAPIGVCLVIVTLSPAVIVVGYETLGHRHQTAVLERILR